MSVIALLIFISLILALAFLACFVWAVKSGQYEDTLTPAMRILPEDASRNSLPNHIKPSKNQTT